MCFPSDSELKGSTGGQKIGPEVAPEDFSKPKMLCDQANNVCHI